MSVKRGAEGLLYRAIPGLTAKSVSDGDPNTYRSSEAALSELQDKRAMDDEQMEQLVSSPLYKGYARAEDFEEQQVEQNVWSRLRLSRTLVVSPLVNSYFRNCLHPFYNRESQYHRNLKRSLNQVMTVIMPRLRNSTILPSRNWRPNKRELRTAQGHKSLIRE